MGFVETREDARNDGRPISNLVYGSPYLVSLSMPVDLAYNVVRKHVRARLRSGTAVVADGGGAPTAGGMNKHAAKAADATVEWINDALCKSCCDGGVYRITALGQDRGADARSEWLRCYDNASRLLSAMRRTAS